MQAMKCLPAFNIIVFHLMDECNIFCIKNSPEYGLTKQNRKGFNHPIIRTVKGLLYKDALTNAWNIQEILPERMCQTL